MTNKEWALLYQKQGLNVIPIPPGRKYPDIKWEKYQHELVTPEQIHKWWNRTPNAGIAIVTGKISNITVVDFDYKNNGLIRNASLIKKMPLTKMTHTGGGGYHYFYEYTDDARFYTREAIVPNVDIRNDGGIVIVPPSTHPSGNKYRWDRDSGDLPFEVFPSELFPEATAKPDAGSEEHRSDMKRIWKGVSEGERNRSASRFIGSQLSLRPEDEWEELIYPIILGWNNLLSPPLPEEELRRTFESIATRERAKRLQAKLDRKEKKQNTPQVRPVAEAFIRNHHDKLVYCTNWRRFMFFDGLYYKVLEPDAMKRRIIKTMDELNPKWDLKPAFLTSVLELLTIIAPRIVKQDDLAHDWFAFNDGILNTHTWEMSHHTPDILVYKYFDASMANFDDPAPNFEYYLNSTLVNKEYKPDTTLQAVYQEVMGSIFSGRKETRRAIFLVGSRDNGKSVLTEAIVQMFEDRFVNNTSLQELTSDKFGKAKLVGKLLNICSEEESTRIKNDTFKALVTGERIGGERKFEHGFDFANIARFIFATNTLPQFSQIDPAMKKRIIIIPFYRTFTDAEKDFDLIDKLVLERSQIVGWALKGLKRLQETKYVPSVCKAVNWEMMKLEERLSTIVAFMSEKYEPGEFELSAKDLYEEYTSWCISNGHTKPFNYHNFRAKCGEIGYKLKSKNNVWKIYAISKSSFDDETGTHLPSVPF